MSNYYYSWRLQDPEVVEARRWALPNPQCPTSPRYTYGRRSRTYRLRSGGVVISYSPHRFYDTNCESARTKFCQHHNAHFNDTGELIRHLRMVPHSYHKDDVNDLGLRANQAMVGSQRDRNGRPVHVFYTLDAHQAEKVTRHVGLPPYEFVRYPLPRNEGWHHCHYWVEGRRCKVQIPRDGEEEGERDGFHHWHMFGYHGVRVPVSLRLRP